MRLFLTPAVLLIAAVPVKAAPPETEFLRSFEGNWSGVGMVLTKIGGTKVNVTCTLKSNATAETLSMNGSCRGLVVVTRAFAANVRASDDGFSGTYTGPSGRPADLSGRKEGNGISFDVTWARVINGDLEANMVIRKNGESGMVLETIDRDLKTGKPVVTSRIDLKRN